MIVPASTAPEGPDARSASCIVGGGEDGIDAVGWGVIAHPFAYTFTLLPNSGSIRIVPIQNRIPNHSALSAAGWLADSIYGISSAHTV